MHSGRKLSASDLQLIILAHLAVRPAHGYELIKYFEDHSHGLYVPSPGMIYPALTYLDEIGHATALQEGNRKLYSITDAGRTFIEDNQAQADREVQLAKGVEGVQSVQNRLMIKDGKSTAGNVLDDSVVTVKVKSALMADDRTRGTEFAVTTNKGVVQLSGFVDSADEQARATSVARNVEGVQSVVNDTSIKK